MVDVSPMSIRVLSTCRPVSWATAVAVAAAPASSISVTNTSAPASASRATAAAPIPLAPPVTTARFPTSEVRSFKVRDE